MITDGKRLHDRTAKNLSALLEGISSNHVGYFYCLNCFHWYRTKAKLKSLKQYVVIMITIMQKCQIKTTSS